jgi:hypothetical protein
MRSVAAVVADQLSLETAEAIRQITQNKELHTLDEYMQPVARPELPEIARSLPSDTAYQIMRAADRLGFTNYSDVLAEVANAVTRKAALPKGVPYNASPQMAAKSFPHPPVTIQFSAEHVAARLGRPGSHPKLAK